jgi:hypothetical protein
VWESKPILMKLLTADLYLQAIYEIGSPPGAANRPSVHLPTHTVRGHDMQLVHFILCNTVPFHCGPNVSVWEVKLFCALTEHYAMKAYWGNEGTAPRILDLSTRWRWVVSFTPRTLYSQGKSPWCTLGRRLGTDCKLTLLILCLFNDAFSTAGIVEWLNY